MGKPKEVVPASQVLIDGVPFTKIKKMRNLKGTWNFFGYDTREAFDVANVSDKEMAEYISSSTATNAAVRKLKSREAIDAAERYVADSDNWHEDVEAKVQEFEQRVKVRVKQYLEDFEAPVVMDRENLENLASAQLRLEIVQSNRLRYMARPVEEQTNKLSRDVFKSLSDEEEKLLQQIRLLQKAMGVDLPTRRDRSEQTTGVDRVQAIVREAKEFLQNEVTEISHCGIRIAWLWLGFSEEGLLFRTSCPRCGEAIEHIAERVEA